MAKRDQKAPKSRKPRETEPAPEAPRESTKARATTAPSREPAPQPVSPAAVQKKPARALSDEDKEKGFTRPVRLSYKHLTCGTVTTMNQEVAESLARDPKSAATLLCAKCRTHPPVADFVWLDENGKATDEKVGT